MATVTLKDIRKSYGEMEVPHGIAIDVTEGEFVALVGPSGCGKSTLSRMIAGLEDLTEGDVHIGDRRVNDLKPKQRDVAMVIQRYALYPQKTVERNMGYALKLARVPRAEIRTMINGAAEILTLERLPGRYPRQFSRGPGATGRHGPRHRPGPERVSVQRAVAESRRQTARPDALGDQGASPAAQNDDALRHPRPDRGDDDADRIVVMQGGVVEQVGPPLELHDTPRNLSVAGFLGSPEMNRIPGNLAAREGSMVVETADGAIPSPSDLPQSMAGREIVPGIRPEHLEICGGADPSSAPAWSSRPARICSA